MINKEKNRFGECICCGYMSLEAAFIVPWAFMIIVGLIYMGYFQYNRCLIFQNNYMLALSTETQNISLADQQNWLDGHTKEQIGNKYIACKNVVMNGVVQQSQIKVSSEFNMQMVPVGNAFISTPRLHATDNVTIANYSYTKRIRQMRTVARVIHEIY